MTKNKGSGIVDRLIRGTARPGQRTSGSQGQQGTQDLTFDEWFAQQPEKVKKLVKDHESQLLSELRSVRKERKDLARKLRDAADASKEGSQVREQLERLSEQCELAEVRVAFYDKALELGIGNLRLAYLAAQDGGFISKKGAVDWDDLKQKYPELFKPATSRTGTPSAGKQDMDDVIRKQAKGGRSFIDLISVPVEDPES